MAPEDIGNNIDDDVLDDLDLEAAIGAAEDLAGSVGGASGLDLDDVMNADSSAEDLGGGVRRYDFNRPSGISRAFEQNLTSVAENFAKTGIIDFTNLLRMTTQVEFQGMRQETFIDYLKSLPNPTCAAMATMAPLKGYNIVNIDLALCFVFMKKLMGGKADAEDAVREFTEIERGINAGLVQRFLEIFRKSATKLVDLEPAFVNLENNPNYLSGIAEGETLIVLKFLVKVDTVEGIVEFGLPASAFGPVKETFDPQTKLELRTGPEKKTDRRKILDMIQGVGSELVVQLGEIDSNLDDVMNLREGDILHLGQSVEAPLTVRIEGEDAWLGEAGRLGQNRAIKLIQQLNKE